MTLPTPDLEALVEEKYRPPSWVTMRELRRGPGGLAGAIDLASFAAWESGHKRAIAFEVKRSRSDFLREIQNPKKRAWVEEQFGECYFVTPPDLIEVDELPEGWGLFVSTKKGDKLRRVKIAQQRKNEISQPLAVMVIRNCGRLLHEAGATPDHGKGKCLPMDHYQESRAEVQKMYLEVQEAREAKARMYEPLARLAAAAGEYGFKVKTPADVDRLLLLGVKAVLTQKIRAMRDAHAALHELIW